MVDTSVLFAGSLDSAVPGWIPDDLLLLPRSLLQGVLGGPACLIRWRASQKLPWRALVTFNSSKHSQVLPVFRDHFPVHPGVRRLLRFLF